MTVDAGCPASSHRGLPVGRRHLEHCPGAADVPRSQTTVAVLRPSGCRPYRVDVIPLGEAVTDDGSAPVLVTIADPDREPELARSIWRRRFGLTAAEAAVATAIVSGHGLGAAAEELGVSLNTVRTHQQHIVQKTQTHSQAELVRLLLVGG